MDNHRRNNGCGVAEAAETVVVEVVAVSMGLAEALPGVCNHRPLQPSHPPAAKYLAPRIHIA